MLARYNAELANGIGNLASRVLALIESNCDPSLFVPIWDLNFIFF